MPKFAGFHRRLVGLRSRFLQAPKLVETRMSNLDDAGFFDRKRANDLIEFEARISVKVCEFRRGKIPWGKRIMMFVLINDRSPL